MKEVEKKRSLGQFFTINNIWLKKHIIDFIKGTGATIAFDPFAGGGDLLRAMEPLGFSESVGLDVDPHLEWEWNDSLVNIPRIEGSVIVTNPPYLTNYSAKRKGIYRHVRKYFESCSYGDLYQLAIEKCLINDYGIMIIPETFMNSRFPKNRLVSITIIEDRLFFDTESPVCVICFDDKEKDYENIAVYKNDTHIGTLAYLEGLRKLPSKKIPMTFNDPSGAIFLRAVDTTDPQRPIQFMKPSDAQYDLSTIKHSSRLITAISLSLDTRVIGKVIKASNVMLREFRNQSHDLLLSPFKGNKKNGERRRRLDYSTARALLEEACNSENDSPRC